MTTYTWRSGGLYGGGGINCVSPDPTGNGRWVAGGDNNGPKWTADNGVSWEQGFGGLNDDNIGDELQTIAVEWSQDATYPDRVWRASGAGLSVSDNAGKDWVVAKNAAAVNFGHGTTRPRIVGHILADDGASRIYMGANESNYPIYRYHSYDANGLNGTLTRIATLSAVVTGLSLDPNSSTTLYVTTRDGVYRLTGITGSSATVGTYSGTGVPTRAEEVVAIDEGGTTRLYVAAYNTVKKVTAGTLSNSWTTITPGSSGSQWCAIDGYYSGGSTYLTAGTGTSSVEGNGHGQVWYSSNGGSSWSCLSADNATCDFVNKMGGPGGDPWWGYGLRAGATPKEKSPNRWIEKGSTVENIRFHPTNRNLILGVGQQGCWAFDLTNAKCYPYLVGAHMGVETYILINDQDDDEIYCVNSDHVGHHTKVGGLNGDWRKNENTAPDTKAFEGTTAFKALAFDSTTTPARWFAGFSHRTANTDGEVYYHNDPSDGTGWYALGFKSFGGGKQAIGLGVRRIGSSVVVIAAVRRGGIAKATFSTADPPVNTVAWAWKNTNAFSSCDCDRRACDVIWASDTLVYAYDPAGTGGLWRSRDAGETWTKIWAAGSGNDNRGGFIAVAPDDPDVVYVSLTTSAAAANRGVWRLNGASTGTVEAGTIDKTEILKPNGNSTQAASCVVAGPSGKMAFIDMTTTETYIYYSADYGVTTQNVTDEFFRRSCKKVFSADMDSQGRIYVTMNGPGIIVGEPDTVTPPEPPPSTPGTITYTEKIAEASGTNGASYTTASFNAGGADRLLVAYVWNTATDSSVPTLNTPTAHSLSWTQQATRTFEGTDLTHRRITVFTALTTTTSSGTFYVETSDAEVQTAWAVYIGEYANIDPAGAVVQSASADWGSTSSDPDLSLGSAVAAHGYNAVTYASVVYRNPAAWTEEVGWTELWDSGASPSTGTHVAHVIGTTDNSFTATGTNGRWAALIMEIAAKPGSSSTGYLLSHDTLGTLGDQKELEHDTDGHIVPLGVRLVTSDASDSDATSYTTASITPLSGEGVVVGVANSRGDGTAADTPSLSGAGLTWTQARTIEYADTDSQRRRITAFLGTGTPSTGTVSISFAGSGAAPVFDAFTARGSGSSGSFSFNHTPVGTPRGALVFVSQSQGTEDTGLTCTYGGTSMTKVGVGSSATSGYVTYAFFLGSSVPTGTQSVAVTNTDGGNNRTAVVYTVTAGADVTVNDWSTIDTTTTAPSIALSTTAETFIAGSIRSGEDDPSNIMPDGSGTADQAGFDWGFSVSEWSRRSSAVTAGTPTLAWTGTGSELSVGIAVALATGATQSGCTWAFVGVAGAAAVVKATDNRTVDDNIGIPVAPSSESSTLVYFAAKKGPETLFTEDGQDLVEEVTTAPNHHLLAGWDPIHVPHTLYALTSEVNEMGIMMVEVLGASILELEHDTDGVLSGDATTPGTGGTRPPKPPKPPKVHWTIGGTPVTFLPGWTATATAMRGFDQLRATLTEAEWNLLGSTVTQGTRITGVSDAGDIMWQGRLAAPAEFSGGLATIAASGQFIRAERKGDRLFIQSKDMDLWSPVDGEPFVNDNGGSFFSTYKKIDVGVGNRIRFTVDDGETVASGNMDGAAFWAEGVPLKRIRFSMIYNSADETSNFEIQLQRATGPNGSTQNVNSWPTSTANNGTQKSDTLGVTEDCLILSLKVASDHTTTAKRQYRIAHIVVNSDIDTGDTFHAYEVAAYIGQRFGWDTSGVASSTFNVLPFDWQDGSWADALTYVAELEDKVWGVWEVGTTGPRLTYDSWGAKNWTLYLSGGADADLTPQEIFNRARVWYQNTHGRTRSAVAVADPDPLAVTGLTNTTEFDLRDRQAGSAVADAVAAKLVQRYSRQRYAGRVSVIHAYDDTGRDDIYGIRPGDTITIADWGPDTSVTLRVYDVTYREDRVDLGVEMPINSAQLLKEIMRRRRERR